MPKPKTLKTVFCWKPGNCFNAGKMVIFFDAGNMVSVFDAGNMVGLREFRGA
jgi:hypothetical protein